jgi:hypothetical protein
MKQGEAGRRKVGEAGRRKARHSRVRLGVVVWGKVGIG